MRRLAIAFAALTVLAAPAFAADAKGQYAAIGTGARPCQDFLAAPKEVSMIVGVWLQGYVTALNQVIPGVSDVSTGKTSVQLDQELVRVCKKNPNMILADAARTLVLSLGNIPAAGAQAARPAKTAEAAAAPAESMPALRR